MDKTLENKNPKISVIMPVYNSGEYLGPAIESVLKQTYKDFEFIIINDGSTDKSLNVINKYAKKDSRIRIISRPNKGLIATLNEGVQAARGEFIARMDGDDISLPNRFKVQIERMMADSELVLLGSNFIIIDKNNNRLDQTSVFTNPQDIKLAIITCNQYGHGSVMMRRHIIEKVGGYDPSNYVEDYDLFARLAREYKVSNIAQPIYKWRRTDTGYSLSAHQKQRKAAFMVRDREFKFFLKHRAKYHIYKLYPDGDPMYRHRKSIILSNLAYLYRLNGMWFRAVSVQLFAVIITPRSNHSRNHLCYLFKPRGWAKNWQYEGI